MGVHWECGPEAHTPTGSGAGGPHPEWRGALCMKCGCLYADTRSAASCPRARRYAGPSAARRPQQAQPLATRRAAHTASSPLRHRRSSSTMPPNIAFLTILMRSCVDIRQEQRRSTRSARRRWWSSAQRTTRAEPTPLSQLRASGVGWSPTCPSRGCNWYHGGVITAHAPPAPCASARASCPTAPRR